MLPGWCPIANRHIGARERRQLIPHVRFQVPFLGPESQVKSGFACAGLLCGSPDGSIQLYGAPKPDLHFSPRCEHDVFNIPLIGSSFGCVFCCFCLVFGCLWFAFAVFVFLVLVGFSS